MASSCSSPHHPPNPHPAAAPAPPGAAARSSLQICGSRAQASLRKIIAVITTVPPVQLRRAPPGPHPNAFKSELTTPPPPPPPPPQLEGERRVIPSPVQLGPGVDLNLRLGPPRDIWQGSCAAEVKEDENVGLSACSGVGEASAAEGGGSGSAPATAESDVVSAADKSSEKATGVVDSNSPAEDSGGGVERSSQGECEIRGEGGEEEEVEEEEKEEQVYDEEGKAYSESKVVRGGNVGGAEEVKNKGRAGSSEGYLGLLLEAVRQVSGGHFGDGELGADAEAAAVVEEEKEDGGTLTGRPMRTKKRGRCWMAASFDLYEVVGEETGPVVRSKRGRSQALPSRYRDSVLEPWRKQSTTGSHQHRRQARAASRTAR